MTTRRARVTRILITLVEAVLVISSLLYVVTSELWALVWWVALAVIYLGVGLAVVWRGQREDIGGRVEARSIARWSWVLPIISSGAGINSAVLALVVSGADDPQAEQVLMAAVASIGIVLSWTLLHVGFAHIYRALDASGDKPGILFPGKPVPSLINYLYFAFTVGTTFATSDAQVVTVRIRRIVMLHSIVSFFYNALVVAVAFQVLQRLVSG